MLQENDIQKSVLEKIHAGNVSMHSRVFFVLRAALLGSIAIFILAGSLFVLSFVFFSIQNNGTHFLLEFGGQGLLTFFSLFPWAFLLLFILLLVALELLVRHSTSAYRFSLLRIFLWILVLGIVGSSLLSLTPLHSSFLSAAEKDRLPLIGPVYTQVHTSRKAQGVYRGDIISITDSRFVISYNDTDRDSDEGTWTVVPPKGFKLSTLSVGDKVYVAGRIQHDIVYAYGIRLVPKEKMHE